MRIIERDEEQSGRHQTLQKEEASTSVNYEISELEEKDLASGEESVKGPKSSGEDYETPSTTPELTQRRISQRTNKGVPPHRLMYKVQTDSIQEPESWSKMLELPLPERERWINAAKEEIKSLNKHQVWELTELSPGKKVTTCKWVFKAKWDGEGRVHTYKARLVAS